MELKERQTGGQKPKERRVELLSQDIREVMSSLGAGDSFPYLESHRAAERGKLLSRWPLLAALNATGGEA